MSVLEWKQFNFFDLKSCGEHDKLKNIKAEITAEAQNRSSQKVFCDASGFVHVYFRNWDFVSFQAHSQPIKLCALTSENKLLVTITQEINKSSLQLQVFNLQKLTKRSGAPCISSAKITTVNSATVLRICLIEEQICIAIGFEKGDIFLYRGLPNRDISSGFRSITVTTRSINGIEFEQKDTSTYNMFVCSHAGVFAFTITENNNVSETKVVLDSNFSPSSCCALQTNSIGETYFIVGRDDALYCFTTEDRGPCYAIEGKKNRIELFGKNLVIVIQVDKQTLDLNPSSQLVIIDVQNKMIVLNKTVDYVTNVIVDSGNCYILSKTKEIYILRERNMKSKLNLVLKKKMFDVALRLLEENVSDEFSAGHINLQYGNYLLQRGDISGAIQKFINTIGVIEPYQIIKKLLDSRYNGYLEQYLKELVKSNFATEKHFELLLNCRERLNLPAKIDSLCLEKQIDNILLKDISEMVEDDESKSELEITLPKFMEIIKSLEKEQIYSSEVSKKKIHSYIMEYGKKLMSKHSRQTMDAIKFICDKNSSPKQVHIQYTQLFIPILIQNSDSCIEFLEYLALPNFNSNKTVYILLLEFYLREWKNEKKQTASVLNFIEKHDNILDPEDVLTLSRSYKFWPGIVYMHEKCYLHHLCAQYILKNDQFKDNFGSIDNRMNLNAQNWLQVLNKNNLKSDNFITFFKCILNAVLSGKNQSILQIQQSITGNQNILVSHFRDFFKEENLQKITGSSKQCNTVMKLHEDIKKINDLLMSFSTKPIEFRCSFCDICRQQLKFPGVYFLCQHSFHKECLTAYSEKTICIICFSSKNGKETSRKDFSVIKNELNDRLLINNAIEAISMFLGEGKFYQITKESHRILKSPEKETTRNTSQASTSLWQGRFERNVETIKSNTVSKQLYDQSKNPFENENENENNQATTLFKEYDSNLNPFED